MRPRHRESLIGLLLILGISIAIIVVMNIIK